MSQANIPRLMLIALALGLAAVGAYLEVHDKDAWFVWVGAVLCFLEAL